jgi:ATP-dependent DNA ligase
MKLHDDYVKQGYEGLVIRDPNAYYQFGGRNRNMLKVKQFQDGEFKVIGYSEGFRDEDFVFKLVTNDGVEFEAKPIGDRKLKE